MFGLPWVETDVAPGSLLLLLIPWRLGALAVQ
jgi:hypothetical protein